MDSLPSLDSGSDSDADSDADSDGVLDSGLTGPLEAAGVASAMCRDERQQRGSLHHHNYLAYM